MSKNTANTLKLRNSFALFFVVEQYGPENNKEYFFLVLRDEFRTEPRDVKVASGEPAELECSGPKGVPDPSVHWTKDGQTLDVDQGNGR